MPFSNSILLKFALPTTTAPLYGVPYLNQGVIKAGLRGAQSPNFWNIENKCTFNKRSIKVRNSRY